MFIGLSGADSSKYDLEGNFVTDSTKYFSYAAPDSEGNASPNERPMSDEYSAKVAIASVADINAKIAAMSATTPDPGTTTTPVTGDSVVWIAALAVVSVLGMALSLKTRKN